MKMYLVVLLLLSIVGSACGLLEGGTLTEGQKESTKNMINEWTKDLPVPAGTNWGEIGIWLLSLFVPASAGATMLINRKVDKQNSVVHNRIDKTKLEQDEQWDEIRPSIKKA